MTSSGAVGAAVVSGLTNAKFQHVNMSTSGGSFIMAVNGADKLRGWDGSAWWTDGDGAHDITGVDTATCINIQIFKRRMWLIPINSTKVWYLPVDSIAGAAASLDFGPLFTKGGSLFAMANWSIDAGIGIDDYAAFISDQGEVAVYKGSDVSSATTWALVGVFLIGQPIGRRCTTPYGGDVLMITRDGLVPLSKALMSSTVTTSIAFTDKIQNAMGTAASSYNSIYGWEATLYAPESMLIMNVPIAIGQQQQYVMNTTTGAWSRWKGILANTWAVFQGNLYFGGSGVVGKAWLTQADATQNINFEGMSAFNYFGNRDGLKQFTLARPLIATDNTIGLNYGVNVDFDTFAPVGVPTFTASAAGLWDAGLWDSAQWGGDPTMQKAWQSVNGVGYCAAIHMVGASNKARIEWSATDYAFKRGGVL